MFKVIINNAKRFRDFLSLDKREYIDVKVTKDFMYFITTSPEVFCIYRAPYQCAEFKGEFAFRLNRFLLSKLYANGIIVFNFVENDIITAIYGVDGKLCYSYRSLNQTAYDDEYASRYDLLCFLDTNMNQIFLGDLIGINNITRTLPSVIHVSEGIAGVVLQDGSRIYKRVSCKGNFSLSSYTLNLLLRFAVSAYNVHNYLCVKFGDLWLCVTKAYALDQEEFAFVESQKSALICDVDFSNLCNLYAQLDVKIPYVDVDLNMNAIKMENHNSVFTIPLCITNLQVAPGFEVKPIKLPSNIIVGVFQKSGISSFRLYKKKNFNELESNGFYVIFR